MDESRKISLSTVVELLLFLSGIILFTYLVQQEGYLFVLSFPCLALSAIIAIRDVKNWQDLKEAFGLAWIRKENIYFIPLAVLAAVFFSIIYRNSLKLDLIPHHFVTFTLLAASIGATEELIFRGYIQTRSRKFGIIISILIAAITHTVYKYVLFSSLATVEVVNMEFLVFWTLAVGLILAAMKEFSDSCYIPIIFHVVFDVLVYGDGAIKAWWVFA